MAATALAAVLRNLRRSVPRQDTAGLTDGDLLARFLSRRDETAFEALLERHGPMVLGVCRRLLQNETDAEDAFQSTFLVLVKKAGSIRPQGMVGNWLYGVAQNTALKARALRSKRLAKETEAAAQARPEVPATAWQQLETLLDQGLKGLPDKYRSAIILCDLEGKSIKEAAQQLGCPPGTIGTRLSRGRSLLARQLARQGLALSPGALAVGLSQTAVGASVPVPLALGTFKAAFLVTAGTAPTGGVISAKVVGLMQAVSKTTLLTTLKIATVVVIIPLLFAVAGVATDTQRTQPRTEARTAESVDKLRFAREGEQKPQELDFNSSPTEVPKARRATPTMKLPPGLARQPVNHPGRVAWLTTHGRPDARR